MVGGISITTKNGGSFRRTQNYLRRLQNGSLFQSLQQLGQEGVTALSAATPVERGETAASWFCEVVVTRSGATLTWRNSHIEAGVNIAIILQYGHGTGTGGYVAGRDYINPVIKPLFERIRAEMRKEVSAA